jgi:hypothetical protein
VAYPTPDTSVGTRSDHSLVGRAGAVVPMGWRKCDGRGKSSLKTRCLMHSEISVQTSNRYRMPKTNGDRRQHGVTCVHRAS